MATRIYLYNSGDTCDTLTGGWFAATKMNYSVAASQSGKVKFNESTMVASISASSSGQAGGKIITKNAINVTSYNKLYFDCAYSESDSNGDLRARFGLFENDVATSSKSPTDAYVNVSKSTSRAVYVIDVSGVSGSYYIGVQMGWSNHAGSANATIYSVYAEAYDLSISSDNGSKVTVYRSYSKAGTTGHVTPGAGVLSNGDTLKISFEPENNYKLISQTVNGQDFISGNTYTVNGDVSIEAVSQPLASDIGATDANIGSTTTITVTRHDPSHTYTLSYSFGSQNGVIAERSENTSFAWSVPTDFYSEIPDIKSAICALTCDTYSGEVLIGSSTCTFKVTAAYDDCSPIVSGLVSDSNEYTAKLTGDPEALVRFVSVAKCDISAEERNSASIVSRSVNGTDFGESDTVEFNNVSTGLYVFTVVDSRGYSTDVSVTKNLIPYIKPTINPVFERPSPTTGEVVTTFNGNFYNGSFGAYDNTLTIRFRYRKKDDTTYSSWETIGRDKYTLAAQSYYTTDPVSLGSVYDYQTPYVFELQAYDGADGTVLSEVTATVPLQKGGTVFDWGENDFAFHVPVSVDGCVLSNLSDPLSDGDAVPKSYLERYVAGLDLQKKHSATTALLKAKEWSSNHIQSVTVTGVTTDNTVILSSAPASREIYRDCYIQCDGQVSNGLVFSCDDIPEEDVTVNVIILN